MSSNDETLRLLLHRSNESTIFVQLGTGQTHTLESLTSSKLKGQKCAIHVVGIPYNYKTAIFLHDSIRDITAEGSTLYLGNPELFYRYFRRNMGSTFVEYINAGGLEVTKSGSWVRLDDKVAELLSLCSGSAGKATKQKLKGSRIYDIKQSAGLNSADLFLSFLRRVVDPRWFLGSAGSMYQLERLFGITKVNVAGRQLDNQRLLLRMVSDLDPGCQIVAEIRQRCRLACQECTGLVLEQSGSKMLLNYLVRNWLSYLTDHDWFDEREFFRLTSGAAE